MKTILCFGDSNTWGWNPATESRFDNENRWPGVLQAALGPDYEVVSEGVPGRTTWWPDPIEGHLSGRESLRPCLKTHQPIDLVIIMLGTNDLKYYFDVTPSQIAEGVLGLGRMVQESDSGPGGGSPRLLILIPPPLGNLTGLADLFKGGKDKSSKFSEQYRGVAHLLASPYLDTSEYIKSSAIDGVHLEADAHRILGGAVARTVRNIFQAGDE